VLTSHNDGDSWSQYGAVVRNDVRDAADCDAVGKHRQALHDEAVATGPADRRVGGASRRGESGTDAITEDEGDTPDVQQECPANFGNSDIFGGSFADPTP
jgi:hypothetical protein